MTRLLRIEYPGVCYRITASGNEQKDIFRDNKDRDQFLQCLETAAGWFKAVIHVYCFMGNHYHFLLSTPEGNLSQIMRHINGGYTTWFNNRHNSDMTKPLRWLTTDWLLQYFGKKPSEAKA